MIVAVGLSVTVTLKRVALLAGSPGAVIGGVQFVTIPLKAIGWPYGVQVLTQFFVIETHGDKTIKPASGNVWASPPPVRIALPEDASAKFTV